MTRKLLLAAAAVLALALAPSAASAHPLGNFSVNHLTQVSVSADRVDVRYILDEAEIPTFQQRNVADAELLRRKSAEVARRLQVIVDGRAVALRPAGDGKLTHPPGQGGLVTHGRARAPRCARARRRATRPTGCARIRRTSSRAPRTCARRR
jgi:hypothetical protein